MSNLPRVPVRFIPENAELLDQMAKSNDAGQKIGATDYQANSAGVLNQEMTPVYRTPHDRENGNVLFRRYPDGTLDLEWAKHQVVDAIHKVRDGILPTSLEQAALSCCFPGTFSYIDNSLVDSVRTVNLRITPMESMAVAVLVAKHLQDELNFMHSCHAR